MSGSVIGEKSVPSELVTVCTGAEWYLFPSHFFLPNNARLAFVRDGFGGVLPQHFGFGRLSSLHPQDVIDPWHRNGTYLLPVQPFNDRNEEELSRYVLLEDCHYVVVVVDENSDYCNESEAGNELRELRQALSMERSRAQTTKYVSARLERNGKEMTFVAMAEKAVLSTEHTQSSIARAYYIPLERIQSNVRYKSYILLKRK